MAADGLRLRLKPIRGVTPSTVLAGEFYFNAVLGDFAVEETAEHVDYSTVGAGEFSVPSPGGRDAVTLKRLTVEVIASNAGEAWLVDTAEDINSTRTTLDAILRNKVPVDLLALVGSGRAEAKFKATVRRVSRMLRHAQGGYRYFEVDFVQWRDSSVGGGHPRTEKSGLPTKHTLTVTDTGRSLSKHYYHHYNGALHILIRNGLNRWGPETPIVKSKKFKVGEKITIPKAPPANTQAGQGVAK